MTKYQLTDFLPTTKKEAELRKWDTVDVVLFSGDAYIDHPSFGTAVIGRVLESEGLKVAIVPQPDWRGDFRDFKKFGQPRMFFAVTAGVMDSMVNHYTANKRLRSNDAYSPNGQAGLRPDRATIVYCDILKKLFPETPIVIGGIEASLRRFSHYDYWSDSYHRSILVDSKADLLIYGMGEQPIRAIANTFKQGGNIKDCRQIPQTAYLSETIPANENQIILYSHEECISDKRKSTKNFRIIEEESNKMQSTRLVQPVGQHFVVVNPTFEPMTTLEIDAVYELPFTYLPHPKYKGKSIPAYEMIRFSVNTHRGCFGGCAFCTISMHQGKFIVSRSEDSILKEIAKIKDLPDFKGYLSDLGGPSANMYKMQGRDKNICSKCKKASCIFPTVCKNMNTDHTALLELYKKTDALPYIKKSFIGSGVRYDLLLHKTGNTEIDRNNSLYTDELIRNHVSGRLKVAPEHTSGEVLSIMRKPSFELFKKFKQIFEVINNREHLKQQIVPYFISSHPGCTPNDMAELAIETKKLNFQLEQIQDFTPTPMTLSTEIYYTGLHPYTLKPTYTAKSKTEKLQQRDFFFWYKPEYHSQIRNTLKKIGRTDLIEKLLRK
ncbi:MAG: YgiQ family radical SAM protein [Paludibacteraceae bacterium]